MYIREGDSELEEIEYENVYQEIVDNYSNEGVQVTKIDRDNIFRVIHRSKAGMLIYSRYWNSVWLPDNLVDRFSIVPDKLAVRCPIAIEPIDDPDCQYRLAKSNDSSSGEHLYPTNSLWQIVGVASPLENRLLEGNHIIALDPSGNRIEIDRSGLDCFVSVDIVLQ
jgi:hypothetical protein